MRLIHYLKIENFKHFGDRQRIELDHPAVLIGPNNCGKTTAIQAIALWSQAVRTWQEAKGKSRPKERTATSLNRLNIVSVPVRRTRYFWHDTVVRSGNRDVPLTIGVGVLHRNAVERVTMRFRNQGDELVYCTPDDATLRKPEAIATAAALNVKLLYPMSGLETEEPILRPGRIDVLLGQGQTAQVLRNLCLIVFRDAPDDWRRIAALMERLFSVQLDDPTETARGGIDLFYRQANVREPLDVALAGRGLQQMLLLVAYLYSQPRSVLLIDEPDAHLEILRQKQVYVLLRELAAKNESQVVLVTHSEVLLDEALDSNLTLLLRGRADDLSAKKEILSALRHYGATHYVRAVARGYVLYVEGRTDLDLLLELARRLGHPAADAWDQRINVFYVRFRRHPAEALLRVAADDARSAGSGDSGQRRCGAAGCGRRRSPDRLLEALRGRELRRRARRAPPRGRGTLWGRAAVRRRSCGDGRDGARRPDPGTRLRRPRGKPCNLETGWRGGVAAPVGGENGTAEAERLRRGVLPPARGGARARDAVPEE